MVDKIARVENAGPGKWQTKFEYYVYKSYYDNEENRPTLLKRQMLYTTRAELKYRKYIKYILWN